MDRPDPAQERPQDATCGRPETGSEPVAADDSCDDGRPAARHVPERTCAVTRARLPSSELIRFVLSPDGTVTPDVAHRLPGRGVWVALDRPTVEKAAASNAFARSLKRPARVPDDLADTVDRLLRARAAQALALANKAGLVVAGFAKVDAAVGSGRLAALVHSREAAPDGTSKLDGRLRSIERERHGRDDESSAGTTTCGTVKPDAARAVVVDLLGGDELSLALGRENVVHAAVIQGGAARYFLTEIVRLGRYRSSPPAAAGRPPRKTINTEQV
ncbi:MAG: RNA-binding protein [Hyphomicrobiaceae bacterium]